MKKNYNKWTFLLILMLFSINIYAQNKSFWTKIDKSKINQENLVQRKSEPKKSTFYQLDITSLKQALSLAPERRNFTGESNVIVDFPNANGKIESFNVMEASIMAPELQERFPNIRSYVGTSLNDPSKLIRFSVTPQGLHTMTLSSKGMQLIDPYGANNTYISYSKADLPILDNGFICGVEDVDTELERNSNSNTESYRNADDGTMREFRLALASTVEYSAFHWQAAGLTQFNTEQERKAAVLAAMVVTMTRVNGIYERDLSITMTLIPNNTSIIFIGIDQFSNSNASALINESQAVIDANIGSANYDIGHTFSTGGGGLAQLNSPCTASKARGITGSPSPVGDAYDVDYVAHEMGHQFGAPHTFNGNAGNCAGGNRTASNAYEPGSGSTIMAYAGICPPQNVQTNSDAYFHQKSLQMIWDNITIGASQCAVTTSTGNAAPTATAGLNHIIPISTPYMLTAESTDADGTDSHTYTWEQYDLGAAGLPSSVLASGPLVRSVTGTTNPTRYIPNMMDLIENGGPSEWEVLSSVSRDINFRVTVRDNDPRGGQTATDIRTLTTTSNAGPFLVTSQNTLTTWSQGNTETITWDVAGTDANGVNALFVDILLSTDGGQTFDEVLATNVPNDGSHDITVPDLLADNCLVMVKGSNNVFFNINSSRIAIGYNFSDGDECNTYTFDLNQTLPTNATAFELIEVEVPGAGTISDVNVKYDISTSSLGDLHMAVISAEGTRAYLYPAGPCSTGSNMQVTWDHESTQSVADFCGNNPVTGVAMPVAITDPEPLNAIYGQEMNGTWIVMAANLGGTNMVFNTAELEICKSGTAAVLAPTRVTQDTVEVEVLSSATIDDTHLVVTSPNTGNTTDIVYTLTVLPVEGTLYLNGSALGVSDTFTQADLDAGNVTYTTTASNDAVDGFRVDVDDSNGGTLPNLLVNISIVENLSTDEFNFEVFNVYPNPSQGSFTVQLSTMDNVSLSMMDIRGRVVYNESFNNSNNTFIQQVNVGEIASGIYLLQVEAEGRKSTKKLIIK
ncbi:reprolysin-like metallopeptidase [Mangrovimonas cancribranchiae]|uniref:M12 family metallo-peptidase n=1 Tax=Mangrovimonas cancribranchiae TaxID=3080055 RepID=A0AAU6NVS0_9FLAO